VPTERRSGCYPRERGYDGRNREEAEHEDHPDVALAARRHFRQTRLRVIELFSQRRALGTPLLWIAFWHVHVNGEQAQQLAAGPDGRERLFGEFKPCVPDHLETGRDHQRALRWLARGPLCLPQADADSITTALAETIE